MLTKWHQLKHNIWSKCLSLLASLARCQWSLIQGDSPCCMSAHCEWHCSVVRGRHWQWRQHQRARLSRLSPFPTHPGPTHISKTKPCFLRQEMVVMINILVRLLFSFIRTVLQQNQLAVDQGFLWRKSKQSLYGNDYLKVIFRKVYREMLRLELLECNYPSKFASSQYIGTCYWIQILFVCNIKTVFTPNTMTGVCGYACSHLFHIICINL